MHKINRNFAVGLQIVTINTMLFPDIYTVWCIL
jgi:hypothetical protein